MMEFEHQSESFNVCVSLSLQTNSSPFNRVADTYYSRLLLTYRPVSIQLFMGTLPTQK